jgi:hypothetical protein
MTIKTVDPKASTSGVAPPEAEQLTVEDLLDTDRDLIGARFLKVIGLGMTMGYRDR